MRKSIQNCGVILSLFLMGLMLTGPVHAAIPKHFDYPVRPWYWYGRPIPARPMVPVVPHPDIPTVPSVPHRDLPTVPSLPGGSKPVPDTGSGVDQNSSARDLTADENHIFKQVNAERAKKGLPALQIDYRLVQTARAKSWDMLKGGYFDHQSPTLGSPFDQMKKAGIPYHYAGENIAGNSSAAGAMVSWMNSSGHRANILNPRFNHIGIGVVDGGPYGKMLTQQFIG